MFYTEIINETSPFNWIFSEFNVNKIIDFIFVVICLAFVNVALDYFVKRKAMRITLGVSSGVFLLSYMFYLTGLEIISLTVILIVAFIGLFVNLAELRTYFSNGVKKYDASLKDKKKEKIEKIFDHNQLYKTIADAVAYFSKHKIGALMTFERKDDLTELIENGSELDCPVTYDLILTIFYPGTRLHDGAVIIRGNRIIAASVLYTLTTKPMAGKFGSRHRAAIGISEISDSVTVVVSEETGRISLVYNGEIQSYSIDNFFTAFENLMSSTQSRTEE